MQQFIIKDADFVVGARYHSIVFAIKCRTPFFALSYEHKIVGMLELLQLSDFCTDISRPEFIKHLQHQREVKNKILKTFQERHDLRPGLDEKSKIAFKIAKQTFDRMQTALFSE